MATDENKQIADLLIKLTYVERFNRTMRYDQLNQELFDTLDQVRQQAEAWLYQYNNERPNVSNDGFTPIQKLNQAA